MRYTLDRLVGRSLFTWSLLAALGAAVSLSMGAEPAGLPWEANLESARSKAAKQAQPMFVMMSAPWCGFCTSFEANTLPHPEIRGALRDFVWVKAVEDKAIEGKYGCGGYPTMVLVDSTGDRILGSTAGGQGVGPFLRFVIETRRDAGLPLSPRLEKLADKAFTLDRGLIAELAGNGDVAGIKKHLLPADADVLWDTNFMIGKLVIPSGVRMDQVIIEGMIGRVVVPDSGVFVTAAPRSSGKVRVRIGAPGCLGLDQNVLIPMGKVTTSKTFSLRKLTARDAIRVGGRVSLPDGRPAAKAIVRICDWDAVIANDEGEYRFDAVSPGTFLVRAECPGAEYHQPHDIGGQKLQRLDIVLKPVATVGIKWAVQTEPGSRKLVGHGVEVGSAYFSVAHSRFSLDRGAEVRGFWGSDLMLEDPGPASAVRAGGMRAGGQTAADGSGPMFALVDVAEHPTGLHEESVGFDSLVEVSDDAERDPQRYFTKLRGKPVAAGQVFTVRCVGKDRYAKIEILSLDPPVR
ncbi:MAG: hypothetical protein FJ309_09665 [Planctomycetes bacterium]|nr:hypothetical protein [Planctomycetota bacterium]